MLKYTVRKAGQSLLLALGVLILAFAMVRMTGDPASLMMSRNASAEEREAFREAMGFNRPVLIQFVDWITDVFRGDFGDSLHFREPALPLVIQRLPATLRLAATGLAFAILMGVPLGLIAGFRANSLIDLFGRLIALLGQSIPNFWLGLILILVFGQQLGWFPVFGADKPESVVLPAFVLSLPVMGELLRLTRSAALEVRNEDFVRTAFSKGLHRHTIYIKHVLPNVAISLVSVIGVEFGYMLGGSIYIETVFAWPGMGQLVGQALGWRDFPLVQTIVVFTSLVVLGLNLLTDLIYALVDPRIRHGK
ncbi:MAG: ABC transporter permease [Anaerolineales bacterium]|nr:MAG: ABC transporter permease [Anaerolineales bacterium]